MNVNQEMLRISQDMACLAAQLAASHTEGAGQAYSEPDTLPEVEGGFHAYSDPWEPEEPPQAKPRTLWHIRAVIGIVLLAAFLWYGLSPGRDPLWPLRTYPELERVSRIHVLPQDVSRLHLDMGEYIFTWEDDGYTIEDKAGRKSLWLEPIVSKSSQPSLFQDLYARIKPLVTTQNG